MSGIDTAILLAAGQGSRLRDAAPVKPLCPVGGRALIDHALTGLAAAGMRRVVVVLGYEAGRIAAHLDTVAIEGLSVETVTTPDYRQPNGVSVLAARDRVAGDALLAMCDHLAEPALYCRVAAAGSGGGARLGIDRSLDNPAIDPDDVTRVRTDGDRIVAIGKGIDPFDCYDTGVFAIGPALFEGLAALDAPSLSEGMARLAGADLARVVDCTGLDWIDVDDAAALAHAARHRIVVGA